MQVKNSIQQKDSLKNYLEIPGIFNPKEGMHNLLFSSDATTMEFA